MKFALIDHIASSIPEGLEPSERARYAKRACIVGIFLNVALCAVKGLTGFLAGSVSIIADAVNNLSDAASSIVSLLGFKLAAKPSDREHPYGHGRFEYLAGLLVAVMVCAVGIELVSSSAQKIAHPEATDFGWAQAIALIASIAVKLWMARFDKAIGDRIDSETLDATAVDARNDVITTSVVLGCALIELLYHVDLDGICGLGVGAFIVISGIQLVIETVNPLLGQAPSPDYVEHIRKIILSYPSVLGTHDLMIHDYGPGRKFASAHVEMPAEQNVLVSHDILDRIERRFKDEEGLVMTLHLDPIVADDPGVPTLHTWIQDHIQRIDPNLTIHDLRCVPGPTHTEVIFDVVKPYGVDLSDDELRHDIAMIVSERVPNAVCHVTIDHGYAPEM